MTGFERDLVKAFNRHFEDTGINGIAYRRKQHRFSSQFLDILVDSRHPDFYLGIENKSLKTSSSNTLYFTQHFSASDDGHQIDRITEFLKRSGRKGYLAVELKRGRGKQRKAYLIPWDEVDRKYTTDAVGLTTEKIKEFPEIERDGTEYNIKETIRKLR
jgi:Holliday junction resolvase